MTRVSNIPTETSMVSGRIAGVFTAAVLVLAAVLSFTTFVTV